MDKTIIRPATDKPEFTMHLGAQTRVFKFGAEQTVVLEERLGKDPLAYLAAGMGTTKFCADAVFAGLSYDRNVRRELSPGTIFKWLDGEKNLDREEFQREVLYAVARGKTGDESIRMVKALDEVFRAGGVVDETALDTGGITKNGPGPTNGG